MYYLFSILSIGINIISRWYYISVDLPVKEAIKNGDNFMKWYTASFLFLAFAQHFYNKKNITHKYVLYTTIAIISSDLLNEFIDPYNYGDFQKIFDIGVLAIWIAWALKKWIKT